MAGHRPAFTMATTENVVDFSIYVVATNPAVLKVFSKMAACKFDIIVRALSSSATQQQMIRAPVQVFGIGGRYATALYSAAVKSKEIDAIEKELVGVQKALKDDVKFRNFMRDPTIKRSVKVNALEVAAKKFNLSKSSSNFLQLVAENGRLKNFEEMLNAFKIIMAAHRGEVTCEVTSAEALDEASLKEVEGILKQFAKGKKILLTTKVDPKILGGLIVTVGDKYVDMSLASKLKKFSDVLKVSV